MQTIRRIPQLALVVILWLYAGGQAGAVGIRVSKPIIEHTLAPGEAVQDSIELINQDEQPVFLDVYLEDWRYILPGDGNKEFAPPQTLPRSCADWVRFFPSRVEVPAHGRAVIDYTIRVPEETPIDGGYYAVLFFEATIGQVPATEVTEKAEPGATVRFAARLGSLILLEVKGTVRREGRLGGGHAARTRRVRLRGCLGRHAPLRRPRAHRQRARRSGSQHPGRSLEVP